MDLTSKIRDYYQRRKEDDRLPTLTVPDAMHLATAILYGASEFHTFDENNETNRRRALLPTSKVALTS
jgi:predicted nucleic acid-binding protein